MIDFEALFKISYGLYIVSSGNAENGNGFISNTVFQVTAEPIQFAACCHKDNYTAEIIQKTGAFSVSILHDDTPPEIIGRFGYNSGRKMNKMESMDLMYGKTGVPIVLNASIAFLECDVVQTIDVGTHYMFIGELVQSEMISDKIEPLTYAHYRKYRKGRAPKNAPTYLSDSKLETIPQEASFKRFKCTACGHIYDERLGAPSQNIEPETLFKNLPDDWQCPVCGVGKEFFEDEKG